MKTRAPPNAAPDLHYELAAALAREGVLRGLANELSWSPKTRDISSRILALLDAKDAP